MITEAAPTKNEALIRNLITAWQNALCARDLDRLMSLYAGDVTLFDVKPPFQTQGATAVRQLWEECLPCFPDTFSFETRDLHIFAGEDVALAHWLFRLTGPDEHHPALQTWMRVTVGYEKRDGHWQIIHDHVSVPFDPETSLAAFTLQP